MQLDLQRIMNDALAGAVAFEAQQQSRGIPALETAAAAAILIGLDERARPSRGLGQEATTRKARPGEVIEPGVDDRLESRQSRLGSGGRVPYLGAEDRRRAVEGLELEALLASERTDDSGLAHPQPLGERADRDPVEPGDRGLADDLAEDRLAGPFGGFA